MSLISKHLPKIIVYIKGSFDQEFSNLCSTKPIFSKEYILPKNYQIKRLITYYASSSKQETSFLNLTLIKLEMLLSSPPMETNTSLYSTTSTLTPFMPFPSTITMNHQSQTHELISIQPYNPTTP